MKADSFILLLNLFVACVLSRLLVCIANAEDTHVCVQYTHEILPQDNVHVAYGAVGSVFL